MRASVVGIRAGAALAVALGLALLGSWATAQQGKGKADGNKAQRKPGGVRVPVGMPPKDKDKDAKGDPLAKAAAGKDPKVSYRFQLGTLGGDYLAATYYRTTRQGDTAPVILLVHDKGRQGRDFEEPIRELEGKSLAEKLNDDGFAVLIPDLRGHGDNPRPQKDFGPKDWEAMTDDLQSAYTFLVDRHNRRELNLAKFAVVGVGTGANLVAHWAARNDAATGPMGRASDLAGLVLVSPVADAEGMKLETDVPAFAFRLPTLLLAGEKDTASVDAIEAVRKVVERNKLSKVATIDSGLKGEFLLRLGPKATEPVVRFLDAVAKFRRDEWEGRYNLDPVAYRDVRPVIKGKAVDKEKEKDKDQEKEKEKDKAKGKDRKADAKEKAR